MFADQPPFRALPIFSIFKATLFGIALQLIRKLWHLLLFGKLFHIAVVKFVDSHGSNLYHGTEIHPTQ